jgi:hypothetical protein
VAQRTPLQEQTFSPPGVVAEFLRAAGGRCCFALRAEVSVIARGKSRKNDGDGQKKVLFPQNGIPRFAIRSKAAQNSPHSSVLLCHPTVKK